MVEVNFVLPQNNLHTVIYTVELKIWGREDYTLYPVHMMSWAVLSGQVLGP